MPPNKSIDPTAPGPSTNGSGNSNNHQATSDAAANVVRGQIDTIFNQQHGATPQPAQTQVARQPQPLQAQARPAQAAKPQPAAQTQTAAVDSSLSDNSAYSRSHNRSQANVKTSDHWKYYHSTWQDYYRQYYERYYLGEVYRMHQQVESSKQTTSSNTEAATEAPSENTVDDHEIFHDLRDDLLRNIRSSAGKVQKSRHFMPFVAATMTVVLFLFLQYNRVLFANVEAYVSPGNINPSNIIVSPTIGSQVGSEPKLIIPKINVDTPVVYDTKPDHQSQMKAMEKGVAWFGIPGANSHPGQVGNTVLSGHSSNDLFDPGEFKFIFARLDKLVAGDTIFVNHKGTQYVYSVTKKEVVKPTDVHKLIYPTDKPMLTLITCVPLGTARDRLLVTAEQISPDPASAQAAPEASSVDLDPDGAMPGNSPTLLGRLFGSGNN